MRRLPQVLQVIFAAGSDLALKIRCRTSWFKGKGKNAATSKALPNFSRDAGNTVNGACCATYSIRDRNKYSNASRFHLIYRVVKILPVVSAVRRPNRIVNRFCAPSNNCDGRFEKLET